MRLLFLGLVACGACAGPSGDQPRVLSPTSASIHTAINPAASFDRYRSYAFGPPEGPPAGYRMAPRTVDVQRRARTFIAAALSKRGYVSTTEKPDFVIMFGAGERDTSIHENSSMGAEWSPDDENADFVEGALVIDAFDGAKGNRVWHGASRANITDQPDDQRLQRTVDALISAFPAARVAAP